MTLTIDLPPEQEARLQAEADARGSDPKSVLQDLVEALPADAEKPKTGAELIARMKREGLFNPNYGDPAFDGPQMAREIREGRWPPRKEEPADEEGNAQGSPS